MEVAGKAVNTHTHTHTHMHTHNLKKDFLKASGWSNYIYPTFSGMWEFFFLFLRPTITGTISSVRNLKEHLTEKERENTRK